MGNGLLLQDIIIKPADKGSGSVVKDKTWYIGECNRQLTDTKFYRRLNEDITADIQKRVTFYVTECIRTNLKTTKPDNTSYTSTEHNVH